MIKTINCINELKQSLEQISQLKFLTIFSSTPLTIKSDNNIVIAEIKGFKKPYLLINLKIYMNKLNNYEKCLTLLDKVLKHLNNLKSHVADNVQPMEMTYDKKSQFFCLEIKTAIKAKNDEASSLTFNDLQILVNVDTVFKIERQINKLGATIYGNKFFEFQQPLQKIEGSIPFQRKIFDKLLAFLNSKTVAPLTFQGYQFNATLTELNLNAEQTVNFKFLEA